MEKSITLSTSDNHLIYGTFTRKKKSSRLIIFIHGLTGYQHEHIFYNGARFFANHGFDVFRFDLYTGEKKGRVLTNTTIKDHASDLDTVVKHFRNDYEKIVVIGHSLGGLAILSSDLRNIDGIVLWDSAHTLTPKDRKEYKFNKSLGSYIQSWGVEYLVGQRMFDEWAHSPSPQNLVQKVDKSILIISAGRGGLKTAGKEYYQYAKPPKEFRVIAGAGHTFSEWGAEEKLFHETLRFLKRNF